jgi:glycerol uptake facilitator-like aquaporin
MTSTLLRRTVCEFLGTGFLVAAVVGSGIMADKLLCTNAIGVPQVSPARKRWGL